ncbi:hypothetical protein HGM15179_005237 [Zosterops borbonicus]|uniref:Uncharacterized protein n=1 Tax=Zosterops borbonicus TaxID=364589 RepID=A0A8K1GPP1_9PASS|nr:hypothetical protein HGM15179_005237 [Zosterops borbonicus]
MSVPDPCAVSAAAFIQLYSCTGDWIWLTAEDASPCADTKHGGQTGLSIRQLDDGSTQLQLEVLKPCSNETNIKSPDTIRHHTPLYHDCISIFMPSLLKKSLRRAGTHDSWKTYMPQRAKGLTVHNGATHNLGIGFDDEVQVPDCSEPKDGKLSSTEEFQYPISLHTHIKFAILFEVGRKALTDIN